MSASTRAVRFRGTVASAKNLHRAGALVVLALIALSIVGVVTPVAAIAYFAVGAGAGYSLSGSV